MAALTAAAAPIGWRVADVEDHEFIIFVKPLEPGVDAEFGLVISERDFGLSLNPTVSVRHNQISDLHAQFFGFAQGPSQVAASVSDLIRAAGRKSKVMWTVESAEGIDAAVAELLDDVSRWGEQFFAQNSSVPAIVRRLEETAATNVELAQLAVAYAVVGEAAKVETVISRLQEMAESQPPFIAEQTRQFLTSYRLWFGGG
jgi:hypothetical protein